MPTIVRLAQTTGELNDVLETRYRVLREAGYQASRQSQFTGKVIDHFDIFPSTLNVLAYSNGKPSACLRAVEYQPGDKLMNLGFDYAESRARLKGNVYSLDRLAVGSDLATRPAVTSQLVKMVLVLLAQRAVDFCFLNCPNELLAGAKKLGFKSIKDVFESPELSQMITPMVCDIAQFYAALVSQIADQEIMRFQEVFYYSVFEPGEVLVVQGEKGSTAYLIDEGEVEVLISSGDEIIPISTIRQGHMIGEVAMVTNEPRTASLIAKVTTSCISFDRAEFMKLMYAQPHRSLDIFKIFSKRLSESNRRFSEMKR